MGKICYEINIKYFNPGFPMPKARVLIIDSFLLGQIKAIYRQIYPHDFVQFEESGKCLFLSASSMTNITPTNRDGSYILTLNPK